MRINALPNALGNALFPFGAEAQGGVLPPPESPRGGYYPLCPPPEYASVYIYIYIYISGLLKNQKVAGNLQPL